jgi:monofunctional biosynthetic peptidoglycan transglycosylase
VLVLWPPLSVLALRVVPPPVTILMLERLAQGKGLEKRWRPLDRISPSLQTAVIAAEDDGFCRHHGFDWEAIRAAAAHNARSPNKIKGGSTISQQTAKNVFLWPSRDYVRKGLEAGYTVLIETLWGKRRILEVYLNVVEWGPGLYGAQAAAQRYFHEDASALTPDQSARLAAILPSPLKWRAVNPGRYVARRSRRIGANAAVVREDDLADCVRR